METATSATFSSGPDTTSDRFLSSPPPLFEAFPATWGVRHKFSRGSPTNPAALPFESDRFDAVFSVGVLEHVRETGGSESRSLAELFRVLKPDGKLICFHLPNRNSYVEGLCRLLFRDAPDDEHRRYHLYRYTRKQAISLFEESGFQVLLAKQYGFLPRNVLGRLPARLKNHVGFTRLVNQADEFFEHLLSPIVQDIVLVATKRS